MSCGKGKITLVISVAPARAEVSFDSCWELFLHAFWGHLICKPGLMTSATNGQEISHLWPQRAFGSNPCMTGSRWQRMLSTVAQHLVWKVGSIKATCPSLLPSIMSPEKANSRGEAGKWNLPSFPCPPSCCLVPQSLKMTLPRYQSLWRS